MADDGFNGATVTFASAAIGKLRSINYSETAAKADVTSSVSTTKAYAAGIPDVTLSVEVVGSTTLGSGDKGALAVAWGDIGAGTDGTIAAAQVVTVTTQGAMDGEVTSTIEFCTAAPTA
ncbi:MAG TPA: hypothetical protein VMY37_22920 [Thermoguttaceae bacterium]|nr:hypothetical protein [Thermoguttaceae bacterium]